MPYVLGGVFPMARPLHIRASLTAFAFCVSALATVLAQQPPAPPAAQPAQPPAQQPPAPPPPKPLIPVATNTVNANPDAYYGQGVTITAAVEQILSKSAFSVDQHRVSGAPAPAKPTDVLVLVPTLQSPVEPKAYVTVMGELVKFDPADVARKAKDYKIDLPPDVIAKYTGRPAMIATSVITEKFVDLAKRLPPPMTADEEVLSKVMKQLPPALAALRTGIDGSNLEDAAKTAAGTLQQACGTCHNTYRERFDDGSFRIKK